MELQVTGDVIGKLRCSVERGEIVLVALGFEFEHRLLRLGQGGDVFEGFPTAGGCQLLREAKSAYALAGFWRQVQEQAGGPPVPGAPRARWRREQVGWDRVVEVVERCRGQWAGRNPASRLLSVAAQATASTRMPGAWVLFLVRRMTISMS